MALSEKIEVVETSRYDDQPQRTLQATTFIAPGELLWWYDRYNDPAPTLFTRDALLAQPEPLRSLYQRFSYLIDDDRYATSADPDRDPSWYFNHSCEPNSGYDGDERIIALRPIRAGEEITYDYAMTETEASMHAGLECRCGSPHCRGLLTFGDWRRLEFVRRYSGHMSSYITAKTREIGWHHPDVYLKRMTNERRGVFALKVIPEGTVIGVFAGKVVDLEHLMAFEPETAAFSLQVSDSLWQVPRRDPVGSRLEVTDQINHCCAANCGMEDSTVIATLRDIQAGEEITLDYGILNSGAIGDHPADNFDCNCGHAKCRGRVTSRDWQLPEVRERYWPYFPPFVRKLMDGTSGRHPAAGNPPPNPA